MSKVCYWGAEDCRHGHIANCPVTEFNLSRTDPWAMLEARRAQAATPMPAAEEKTAPMKTSSGWPSDFAGIQNAGNVVVTYGSSGMPSGLRRTP